jgi:serine/threonine protein kinase
MQQGEFGVVHRGAWHEPGKQSTPVALKTLSVPDPQEKFRLLQEAVLMSTLSHQHIIRLFGVVTFDDPVVLVLEYMPDGALDSLLRGREYTVQQLFKFSLEVCSAMVFLSDNRYLHRDLAT